MQMWSAIFSNQKTHLEPTPHLVWFLNRGLCEALMDFLAELLSKPVGGQVLLQTGCRVKYAHRPKLLRTPKLLTGTSNLSALGTPRTLFRGSHQKQAQEPQRGGGVIPKGTPGTSGVPSSQTLYQP